MIVEELKYTYWEVSGVLRDAWSDTICLMVHGFQSYSKSRLMRNYAVRLAKKWINTLRIDLYNLKYRSTMEVSLDDHIWDVECVLADIANKYIDIIYIGHSLGWSICWLISNNSLLSWALLWDAAIPSIVKFDSFLEEVEMQKEKCMKVVRSRTWIIATVYGDQISSFDENYFAKISCAYLAVCCEYVWFYDHPTTFKNDELKKSFSSCLMSL